MGSRFVSAVAFYGPKTGPLRDLLAGTQALIADYVGDDFRAYSPEQVHATLIALNGVRDGNRRHRERIPTRARRAYGGRWTCRG